MLVWDHIKSGSSRLLLCEGEAIAVNRVSIDFVDRRS